jgi:hypothetical protein
MSKPKQRKWHFSNLAFDGPIKKRDLMRAIKERLDKDFPTDVVHAGSSVHVHIEGMQSKVSSRKDK